MTELKPCPFCGGEAIARRDETGCRYVVACKECPVIVGNFWYTEKTDAIKAWNRRVGEADDETGSD